MYITSIIRPHIPLFTSDHSVLKGQEKSEKMRQHKSNGLWSLSSPISGRCICVILDESYSLIEILCLTNNTKLKFIVWVSILSYHPSTHNINKLSIYLTSYKSELLYLFIFTCLSFIPVHRPCRCLQGLCRQCECHLMCEQHLNIVKHYILSFKQFYVRLPRRAADLY